MNLIISAGDDFYRYSLGFGVELYGSMCEETLRNSVKIDILVPSKQCVNGYCRIFTAGMKPLILNKVTSFDSIPRNVYGHGNMN